MRIYTHSRTRISLINMNIYAQHKKGFNISQLQHVKIDMYVDNSHLTALLLPEHKDFQNTFLLHT
jgi:hypothetical protein